MECEKLLDCPFFAKYKDLMEGDTYRLFIDSYCCGALMDRCKRKTYEMAHGEAPPDNFSPSGYTLKNEK